MPQSEPTLAEVLQFLLEGTLERTNEIIHALETMLTFLKKAQEVKQSCQPESSPTTSSSTKDNSSD